MIACDALKNMDLFRVLKKMSKRFLTQQLAKEDVKRAKCGRESISKEISQEEAFKALYNMVSKKFKPNETDYYMKTSETWMRRLGSATVAQLSSLVDAKVETNQEFSESTDKQSVSEIARSTKTLSQVSLAGSSAHTTRDSQVSSSGAGKSEIGLTFEKGSGIEHRKCESVVNSEIKSIASSRASSSGESRDAQSIVPSRVSSKSTSVVGSEAGGASVANSKIVSESNSYINDDSHSVAGSDIRSNVSKNSHAYHKRSVSRFPDIPEDSSVTGKTSVALEHVSTLLEETEDSISRWYERSLSDLNIRQLRDEQYRRKRAMLRVEYWTKMDKLKNNATPTVVNCT